MSFNNYIFICFFVFIIILCILLLYNEYNKYNDKYKNKLIYESFLTKSLDDTNVYIDREQLINPNEFINQWDKIITEYISYFNEINIKARQCCKTKEELITTYKKGILYISDNYLHNLNIMLEKYYKSKKITDSYIIKLLHYIIPKIKILHIDDNIENGLPHTHKNIICLNKHYFYNPSIMTFIHECIHIHQRIEPLFYKKIYHQWGFIEYDIKNIKNIDNIIKLNRVNPDGLNLNWLWKSPNNNYYLIGAIFNSTNPSSLLDVTNLCFKIDIVNGIFIYRNNFTKIELNDEYITFFGHIEHNNYHPNEISAEYLSNLYNYINTKAGTILYNELKLIL